MTTYYLFDPDSRRFTGIVDAEGCPAFGVVDAPGSDADVFDTRRRKWCPAPAVAAAVPAIPSVVTMRQARLALLQAGLLAQVNTAVAAADEATRVTWEFSSEVQRGNALVVTLTAALNLTKQQLDDLFILGAKL